MIDSIRYIFSVFLDYSDKDIGLSKEPLRWLPILVLVYLWFELYRLQPLYKQIIVRRLLPLTKEELLVQTLALRQRLLFLVFLTALLSSFCAMRFLFQAGQM